MGSGAELPERRAQGPGHSAQAQHSHRYVRRVAGLAARLGGSDLRKRRVSPPQKPKSERTLKQ